MGIITPPNNSLVMGRTSKTDLGLISKDFGTVAKSGMMFGTAAGGAMLALPAQGAGAYRISDDDICIEYGAGCHRLCNDAHIVSLWQA